MVAELSSEFKTAFGRLLVGLKMANSIPNALNYSGTLIEYTRAGLAVMGKEENYKEELRQASSWYKTALLHTQVKGRNEWIQNQILALCFNVNSLIFPIALKEGVLVLNEEMFSVQDMFMGAPPPDESHGRRR